MSRTLALLIVVAAVGAWSAQAADDGAAPGVFLSPDGSSAARQEKPTPVSVDQKVEPIDIAAEKKPETATPVAAEKDPLPAPQDTAAENEKKAGMAEKSVKADKSAKTAQVESLKEPPLPPLSENEQKIHALVKEGFALRASLKIRTPQEISANIAAVKAIDRNLSVLRQEKQEDIALAAKREAKAVFDPVITISFNHTMLSQNNRMVGVSTFQRGTVKDIRDGANVLDQAEQSIPKFPVKRIVFSQPRPQGYVEKRNIASVENPNGPVQTENPSFRVDQQLPWGPSFFFNLASRKQEQYFDDGPDPELDAQVQALTQKLSDPAVSDAEKAQVYIAQQEKIKAFKKSTLHYKSNGHPWTSQFSTGLFVPIPFTKNWGQYSQADLSQKQASLGIDRAYWDTKTVINATLRDVDFAYWTLVGTLESLRALTENRKLMETMQGNSQKMLDANRTTAYGKIQVDQQVAAVKEQEESAWASFLQASNALVNLLDLDEKTVLLPAGYTKNLTEQMTPNTAEAFAVAMENRPDLKAQRVSGKVSSVLYEYQKRQARPDLSGTATLKMSQNQAPFGFQGMGESLGALFGQGSTVKYPVLVPNKGVVRPAAENQVHRVLEREKMSGPDIRAQTYSLNYNWPFRNRAAKAAVVEAGAEKDKTDISTESIERQVENDVGNAVAGIFSAKVQYDTAQESYKLSKEQYDMAVQNLDAGRTTEFELVTRSIDLLNADLAKVSAGIFYKQAESQLLQSEGILANTYAQARSQSELDDLRLEALAAARALKFFAPVTVTPDAEQEKPAATSADAGAKQ